MIDAADMTQCAARIFRVLHRPLGRWVHPKIGRHLSDAATVFKPATQCRPEAP